MFVIDSVDLSSLEEARQQLHGLLEWQSLEGIPLLVLGKKNDLEGALTEEEIIEELSLRKIANR